MTDQIKKYWFFIGIAVMVLIAFFLPAFGTFIHTYKVLNIGIFLAFLVTGLSLETSSILRQLKNVKVLFAALLSSLVLFPAIAYLAAEQVFRGSPDFAIGALIIGVAPVTVASGTVMTAIALGNVPLSLFICIFGNLVSIFTIPIILNLFLQFGDTPIDLPVVKMLTGLVVKVLIPTVIGQLLRPKLKNALKPYKKAFSIFNQCIVLLIILNAVSSSTGRIVQVGSVIVLVFLFMIVLHLLILGINYALSRLIRLDTASSAAFTIHTSQKTLTVSYLVWAGYFAKAFPMALIPSIAYHLTQMILDTFVAHAFRKRSEAKKKPAVIG
ncbi:MAG: bile acid:sodium symporter [Pseudomonadota bacterium]